MIEEFDDEADYVPGDAERVARNDRVRFRSERIGHPFWRALRAPERIAIVRWLQRGDVRGLLTALARNPSSQGLRGMVAEGLAGGSETGWRIRIASSTTGGAPRKAEKALLSALQAALAGDGGDVAALARAFADLAQGERSTRRRRTDPMEAAMIGLAVEVRRARGMRRKVAVFEVACDTAARPARKGENPHNLSNTQRLYDNFLGAGKSSRGPQPK